MIMYKNYFYHLNFPVCNGLEEESTNIEDRQKMKNVLDASDIDEALMQPTLLVMTVYKNKQTGTIVPDAFTHGTSQQRMY